MKSVLRYAENAAGGNSAKLAALGWSGKAARRLLCSRRASRVPWRFHVRANLDWKNPAEGEGGKAAFYRLERRKLPGGSWELAGGMAVESEATLVNQERGKEWEYRVIAVNKAGESGPGRATRWLRCFEHARQDSHS